MLDPNDFNPHHHAGGDEEPEVETQEPEISIHTTTQVVTSRK